MSEKLTSLERTELTYLARQTEPVWGGHLKRGEPPGQSLARYLSRGWVEVYSQVLGGETVKGYRITEAGRKALQGGEP